MIDQIIQLLMQAQQGDRTIPVPNDMGAGGMMHMPIPQPSPFNQSMRPPMQEGPAPPRRIAELLMTGLRRGPVETASPVYEGPAELPAGYEPEPWMMAGMQRHGWLPIGATRPFETSPSGRTSEQIMSLLGGNRGSGIASR